MTKIRDAVRARLDMVHTVTADHQYGERALADVPGNEIPLQLAADERLRTVGALGAVLDRATDELRRDVNAALQLIDAVVACLPALPAASGTVVLHGRALRLRANGLRMTGAVPQARGVLGEAQRMLAQTPAGAIELEHARILEAYMLNESGERDDALRLVRQAANGYAAQGDAKGSRRPFRDLLTPLVASCTSASMNGPAQAALRYDLGEVSPILRRLTGTCRRSSMSRRLVPTSAPRF